MEEMNNQMETKRRKSKKTQVWERLWFSSDCRYKLFVNPQPLEKHSPVWSVCAKCPSPLFPVLMSPRKGQRHIKAHLRSLKPLLMLQSHPLWVPHSKRCHREQRREDVNYHLNKELTPVCLMCMNANHSLQKSEVVYSNVLYWTKGKMEQNLQERSEGIMHFFSPYWRCIEFFSSERLDKIYFELL